MFTTLISTSALAGLLAEAGARVVVLDCRFDLANLEKGREAYDAGHLAGAIHADLNRDLSGEIVPGVTGRHPLPDVATFAAQLGAWGIDNATQVVAYDDSGASYAARLWWMLRWLGHDSVAVLDGGWKAWTREGRATDSAVPQVRARTFVAQVRPQMVASIEEVAAAALGGEGAADGQNALTLLDARAADRFRGENETIDPVGGHIPSARNAPWLGNLDGEGYVLGADALRARFAAILPTGSVDAGNVVAYCGSGVTAAHNVLAMEVAGFEGARLFPGSWSEWITDPARPVATATETA